MSRSSRSTTDHEEIQSWAESRDGQPAIVRRGRSGGQDSGILRIDFPGFSGAGSLEEISWDEWFRIFDERNLAFLFDEKPGSRFNKLVSRQSVRSRARRGR